MPRTPRTSIPAPLLGLLAATLALGLTACGGDDPSDSTSASSLPAAKTSNPEKSCQGIVGSGAIDDVQAMFDKYKNNSNPFTTADAEKMRDALDRLLKAGDNAAPKIRDDVVTFAADVGSLIDARAGIGNVGEVASPAKIQKELDALCR